MFFLFAIGLVCDQAATACRLTSRLARWVNKVSTCLSSSRLMCSIFCSSRSSNWPASGAVGRDLVMFDLLRRRDKAGVAKVVDLQHRNHFPGFGDKRFHGLVGMHPRAGAMFQEDRHQPIHLDLCFGAMMNEYALQYRMRGGSRHAQQRISELRFHAYQFLQFCKVHVLEVADFHGSDPFVSVSQGVRMEPEQRGAAAVPSCFAQRISRTLSSSEF